MSCCGDSVDIVVVVASVLNGELGEFVHANLIVFPSNSRGHPEMFSSMRTPFNSLDRLSGLKFEVSTYAKNGQFERVQT